MPATPTHNMATLAWILVVLLVFVLGLSFYGSLEITRIPTFAVPYTPNDFGWVFEDVSFLSPDGLRLKGWFIPASQASDTTIIVQHGVGSNHGDMLPNTACLHRDGRWNLFYYNFRGHGDSEGRITSLGPLELQDLQSAIKYLQTEKPQTSKRLGIYGHSLGAAVAIVGAARFPELKAVAAESSFASISMTVRRFSKIFHGIPYFPYVPLALMFTSWRLGLRMGHFDPVEAIGQIAPRPVFLIQGERDMRMPMSDFQALWDAAKDPKEQWVVPGADHGDPWMIDRETYEKKLVEFFRKAFA
jgi:fermentation-respiration switch protein FrsA (DUF1100 family)